MKRIVVAFGLTLSLIWAFPCLAANASVYRVEVNDKDAQGPTGAALAYELKEQIRASSGFVLTSEGTHLVIYLTTLNPLPEDPAYSRALTVFSVIFVARLEHGNSEPYLGSVLGRVPTDGIKDTAKVILAELDRLKAKD